MKTHRLHVILVFLANVLAAREAFAAPAKAPATAKPAAAPKATAPVLETPEPGRKGTFVTKFTARSPLSAPKELAPRLVQKTLGPDYDLSQETFIVCVPDNYDPARPMGLVVVINFKDSGKEPAPETLSVFKEHNLAFVVCKKSTQEWWVRCGLALDAVHNMQSLYKIDPARLYLFGYDFQYDSIRLAMGCSDVFAGLVVTEFYATWKPMRSSNKGIYPPKLPTPPSKYLLAAKSHPIVFCRITDHEEQTLIPRTYQADGFKYVKVIKFDVEDYHYPKWTKGWLTDALKFLDEHAEERSAKSKK